MRDSLSSDQFEDFELEKLIKVGKIPVFIEKKNEIVGFATLTSTSDSIKFMIDFERPYNKSSLDGLRPKILNVVKIDPDEATWRIDALSYVPK